jgi:hypothetical protein
MVGISTYDETDMLEDILAGLRAALAQTGATLGDNEDDEFRQVEDIQVNKLVQHAVEDANLPVSWSWFRYGQSIPRSMVSGSNIHPEELGAQEKTMSQKDIVQTAKTREGYRDYFINDVSMGEAEGIRDICDLSIDEFLKIVYDEAPVEHRDLYVANLEMQNMLRRIALQDGWVSDEEYYDVVWNITRNFQKEMIRHKEFTREMRRPVSKYLRIVRQVVVAAQENEEVTPEQRRALKDLASAYHEPIWKSLSMKISAVTTTGRDEGLKQNKYEDEVENIVSQARSTIETLPRELDNEGLISGVKGFPEPADDELQTAIAASETRIYS